MYSDLWFERGLPKMLPSCTSLRLLLFLSPEHAQTTLRCTTQVLNTDAEWDMQWDVFILKRANAPMPLHPLTPPASQNGLLGPSCSGLFLILHSEVKLCPQVLGLVDKAVEVNQTRGHPCCIKCYAVLTNLAYPHHVTMFRQTMHTQCTPPELT